MKCRWILKFIFKSNEYPWTGEHRSTIDLDENEANKWLQYFEDKMPEYYITLHKVN